MHVDPSKTLQRQWTILRLIPAWPGTTTVTELRQGAIAAGFNPGRSTIERDLTELSGRFPLTVDTSGKTHRWGWEKSASIEMLPRLSVQQCLALTLARQHVSDLLPKNMLADLQPLFDAAEKELAPTVWKDWHKRTAVAPVGFTTLPPKIDDQVLADVQHATAHRLLLTATYESLGKPPRQRTIHPLGLLVRGHTQYLVSKLPEYPKPRELALHRMTATSYGSEPCQELHGFTMAKHVRNLAIERRGKIRLRLHFTTAAAEHLKQTRIAKYQTWKPIKGKDKVEICATVEEDLQLKRWLRSFGSEVVVMGPEHLRREMIVELEKALEGYRDLGR